jgi:hydroxymethylpyrimidine pyrophosphatase-like HAD family hydrolase
MFTTDLDRTIIFSKRFLTTDNEMSLIPIEEKEGRIISYMTKVAYEKLNYLRKNFSFIPATARKFDEIMRINFIREDIPEWMICESGRVIYHNGSRWGEWDLYLSQKLQKEKQTILKAHDLFDDILKEYQIVPWYINESMKMAKTDKLTDEDRIALEKFTEEFSKLGCFLYLQQRKIYLMPKVISKRNAVAFLIKHLQPTVSISAGDAEMDCGMFEVTKHSIAPKHHTISTTPPVITNQHGVYAGEEIISFALENLR